MYHLTVYFEFSRLSRKMLDSLMLKKVVVQCFRILLSEDWNNLKLADFGAVKRIDNTELTAG